MLRFRMFRKMLHIVKMCNIEGICRSQSSSLLYQTPAIVSAWQCLSRRPAVFTVNRGYFVHRGNFEHHGVTLYAFSKHLAIFSKHVFLLLLLFNRPLPRDGGMAEDHGAPEAGQLPRVWTRSRTETESRQRVSGTKSP